MNTRTLISVSIVLFVLALVAPLQATDQMRVAYPGEAQFSGADIPEHGPAVVAWRSTDQKWSKVTILRDGETVREWSFQDLLVKSVRWIDVGERFLTGSVGANGPIDHLYSIEKDGTLALEWSTAALERDGVSIAYSADGSYWLSSQFSETSAKLSFGTVGDTKPLWEWDLAAEEYGKASPLAAEQFSYAVFLERPDEPTSIGVLWGSRLWLARPGSDHLVRIVPPRGCDDLPRAFSTSLGLWARCYDEDGGTPGVSRWAFYAGGFDSEVAERRPAFVEQFRSPRFRPDGTILDVYKREGVAGVYELNRDHTGLTYLGNLDFPTEARVRDAGDSLLVEVSRFTDDYRVLPLKREVATLRQAAKERGE